VARIRLFRRRSHAPRRRVAGGASGVVAVAVAVAVLGAVVITPPAGAQPAATSTRPVSTHQVHGDTVPVVAHLGPTSFSGAGPYGVGETTLTLPIDHAPVEVWYPATPASVAGQPEAAYDVTEWLPAAIKSALPAGFTVTYPSGGVRGVAVAPGRFPLVVFSHGYAGFRDQSTFLTARLASWGFVVAAPDHDSRDLTEVLGGRAATGETAKTTDVQDLEVTIALMHFKDTQPLQASAFHGHVDTSLVGAVGHSSGGAAVEALAAADPHVTTFIGLAGATVGSSEATKHGPASVVPQQPGMLMVGTEDHAVGESDVVGAYKRLRAPKRLVLVQNAGHLVFADVCEVGTQQGGLLAIANELHVSVPPSLLPLATDGCQPPDVPPPTAWPLVWQAVTAQLRHVFGFDRSAAGLTGLATAFPTLVAANQAKAKAKVS
jgi:predicted dienelactone hydrolase